MAAADFRDRLLAGLGGDWPKSGPLNAKVLEETKGDGFRRLKVTYEAEPGEPSVENTVPAYLLIPDGAAQGKKSPAVCVWHQHNGAWHLGASEPAGLAGMPMHHSGGALATEGYVVRCRGALGCG